MIEFELDIPSLTEHGIQLRGSFVNNDWNADSLDSFNRIAIIVQYSSELNLFVGNGIDGIRVFDKHYLDALEGT